MDSQIEYGNSDVLGSVTNLDSSLTMFHSVTISGLTPNTNYIFRVKSKPLDVSVATVSINGEFNTLSQEVDIVPPANVTSVSSGNVTNSSASIAWTTDKPTTSQVEYGITTSYGQSSVLNQSMQTSHFVSLTNLDPATVYHFRVKSTDEVSNVTYSEDHIFTTSAPSILVVENTNPQVTVDSTPSALLTLAIGAYDENSVALTWHTNSETSDVTAEYDIRYSTSPINESNFNSASQAQSSPILYNDLSPNGIERVYIVAGLNPNTTYYFALKLRHENGNYSPISNVVSQKTTTGVSIINNEIIVATSSTPIESGGKSTTNAIANDGYGSGYSAGGGGSSGSYIPTVVKAEPADSQIIFSWHNPGEADFVRTVIVRKEGSYPTVPTDGQTIYEGSAETFTDTNVQNGKTYYYSLYSYNHAKTYSSPINISLAPNSGNQEVKFNESGVESSLSPTDHFNQVFKKGDKDIEIEHLQEILSIDGNSYPEKYVTGYFGELTEAATKRFQAKHRLPQTGVIDAVTQAELNILSKSKVKLEIPQDYALIEADLYIGDKNTDDVADLQTYLMYEGSYPEGLVTGYFGNLTKAAVKRFQAKYGIDPVTGNVAYKTRHKMKQLTGL